MAAIRIGDEISFHFGVGNLLKHVGLVAGFQSATGEPLVAHNSERFGEVKISPLREFADGRPVTIRPLRSRRDPLHLRQAISSLVGKPYDAVKYNCEHFASEALGLRPHSPQLVFWATLALLGGAAYLAAASRQ